MEAGKEVAGVDGHGKLIIVGLCCGVEYGKATKAKGKGIESELMLRRHTREGWTVRMATKWLLSWLAVVTGGRRVRDDRGNLSAKNHTSCSFAPFPKRLFQRQPCSRQTDSELNGRGKSKRRFGESHG